jgi:hypothetical protein
MERLEKPIRADPVKTIPINVEKWRNRNPILVMASMTGRKNLPVNFRVLGRTKPERAPKQVVKAIAKPAILESPRPLLFRKRAMVGVSIKKRVLKRSIMKAT